VITWGNVQLLIVSVVLCQCCDNCACHTLIGPLHSSPSARRIVVNSYRERRRLRGFIWDSLAARGWTLSGVQSGAFILLSQLFCTVTNKCTTISQISTLPLHVSTLSCYPQGACNHYLTIFEVFPCFLLSCKTNWHFNDCNMRTGINPVWNILAVNCITNSCIWNTGVTCQGIDYRLSEDDTIVSKHVGVW